MSKPKISTIPNFVKTKKQKKSKIQALFLGPKKKKK